MIKANRMKTRLRVHYFSHIKDEGLGSPEAWLRGQQAIVTMTPFFAWQAQDPLPVLPELDTVDLLIIMGGAMSVNQMQEYPWLITEKAWISDFILSGKPVVGLCLGAQLIACSLGAGVTRNPVKEIGWWQIEAVPVSSGKQEIFAFPDRLVPLSWHEDAFALPEGAVPLATSPACSNQAFQYGDRVLAFQFHPETTPESLELFLHDADYLELGHDEAVQARNRYIQPPDELGSVPGEMFVAPNQMLERALDFVTRPMVTQ